MEKEPKKKIQIVEAAEKLFNQFGFKKVSVEEICEAAGASKMTFYKYFANKNELIKHLWQVMIDASWVKLDKLDQQDVPFAEKVKMIIKMKEEATSQMGSEYIHDYLNMVPELMDFYNQIFGKVMTRFMEIIRKAQEKGEVRKSIRPEFFLTVINMMMELAKNEQLAAVYANYTDFALEINNFLYYGLMPVPEKDNS
jgi:AcrR family transcriptional regulator